jgi:hypothetical protein
MNEVKTITHSIGGYLPLELPEIKEHYDNLVRLNTGRNALEYILKQGNYVKIYMPYFTCDVLLEPVRKLNIVHQFYNIDEALNPIIDFEIEPHACFLYTNYFGIKQATVDVLSKQIKNLIIDNSQAFFCDPLPGIDTFYSCRKFFGVPDGAYLQVKKKIYRNLPVDTSFGRLSHLVKSIDMGIEAGYPDYKANNKVLENNKIMVMSHFTQKVLSGINYAECFHIRKRNFNYLHKHLKDLNLLTFDFPDDEAPMVYPFLFDDRQLKLHLIQKKVYVATYWPNVFDWTSPKMFENFLARCLVPLPIDHRYTLQDMFYMLNVLKQFI